MKNAYAYAAKTIPVALWILKKSNVENALAYYNTSMLEV
jgi:hypothetical protein